MYYKYILLLTATFLTTSACSNSKTPEITEATEIEVNELRDYYSLFSEVDLLLGLPVRIKHDHYSQHLFIQDAAHMAVIELDEQFNEVRWYGKQGRGPGEFQNPDDFFITDEHLFIVDGSRFLIHKYSREDGQFISSLDYGALIMESVNTLEYRTLLTPPAPLNSDNNRPFVTLNETVLLPSHTYGEFLYRAVNWQGEKIADIGEIPEGYAPFTDDSVVRAALQNMRVPPHELALAFPVNDPTELNEIYLVYSAIPKIARYTLSGNKVWEKDIPVTPEIDSLITDLSNVLNTRPNHRLSLVPVKKYMAGRHSPQGGLYLFTYTNMDTPHTSRRPMWIHQFDTGGTLVHRYKIISDTDLFYYPEIDFKNRRIFTPAFNESDVRIYSF